MQFSAWRSIKRTRSFSSFISIFWSFTVSSAEGIFGSEDAGSVAPAASTAKSAVAEQLVEKFMEFPPEVDVDSGDTSSSCDDALGFGGRAEKISRPAFVTTHKGGLSWIWKHKRENLKS